MTTVSKLIFAIVFMLLISTSAFAQADDNPFLLQRGDNELGFWAGFSPAATTVFGGLRDDEAEDRKFFIAAGWRSGRRYSYLYIGNKSGEYRRQVSSHFQWRSNRFEPRLEPVCD